MASETTRLLSLSSRSYNKLRAFKVIAIFNGLAFCMFLGVGTEIFYGFFELEALQRSFAILGLGPEYAKKCSYFPVAVDVMLAIMILQPITEAKKILKAIFGRTEASTADYFSPSTRWLVRAGTGLWFISNWFSEGLGVLSIIKDKDVAHPVLGCEFFAAMFSYYMIFMPEVFDGLKILVDKDSSFRTLWRTDSLLAANAAFSLLIFTFDWLIGTFYSSYRAYSEILDGKKEHGFYLGAASVFLSSLVFPLMMIPTVYTRAFAAYGVKEITEVDRDFWWRQLSFQERLPIVAKASFWAVVRSTPIAFLVANSLLPYSIPGAVLLSVSTALALGIPTLIALCREALNNTLAFEDGHMHERWERGAGHSIFLALLIGAIIVSQLTRRALTIEFNDLVVGDFIGGYANAYVWVFFLLVEVAPTYGQFFWKRLCDVEGWWFDNLVNLLSFIASLPRACVPMACIDFITSLPRACLPTCVMNTIFGEKTEASTNRASLVNGDGRGRHEESDEEEAGIANSTGFWGRVSSFFNGLCRDLCDLGCDPSEEDGPYYGTRATGFTSV